MLKPNVQVTLKPKWPAGWNYKIKYPGRFGGGAKVGVAVSRPDAIARVNSFLAKKDLGTYVEGTT